MTVAKIGNIKCDDGLNNKRNLLRPKTKEREFVATQHNKNRQRNIQQTIDRVDSCIS